LAGVTAHATVMVGVEVGRDVALVPVGVLARAVSAVAVVGQAILEPGLEAIELCRPGWDALSSRPWSASQGSTTSARRSQARAERLALAAAVAVAVAVERGGSGAATATVEGQRWTPGSRIAEPSALLVV
jgi:hypothetical protein